MSDPLPCVAIGWPLTDGQLAQVERIRQRCADAGVEFAPARLYAFLAECLASEVAHLLGDAISRMLDIAENADVCLLDEHLNRPAHPERN